MSGRLKGKWLSDKVIETPTGVINGANVTFVLSQFPATANQVQLFLDGLLESAYTINLGTKTITMTTAPELGQSLRAEYRPK